MGREVLGMRPRTSRVRLPPLCTASEPAVAIDLVGDGGVLKQIQQAGRGPMPQRGAMVEVHYDGTLTSSGVRFDSSRERGKTFKFKLGEGRVIGGWEVGVSSMRVGEKAVLTCAPQYAYGEKGIPPTIPPSSTLEFEVELLAFEASAAEARTFADDNPNAARTPTQIQQAYERRMAVKEEPESGIQGLLKWAKGIYIFGFFADEKGEMPPWYLNPLITFPAIFAVVGLTFYVTVGLDGVHRGEVAPTTDDIASLFE